MNREILVRIAPTWEPDMPLIRWMRSHIQYITIPFALALFLLSWQTIVTVNRYPTFILPTPAQVAASFL